MDSSLPRRLVGEFLGTAFLLMAIVGSGIMAQRLFNNDGLVLLANALATGGALIAVITTFSGISGAHLNPAVTLSAALQRSMPWSTALMYTGVQLAGAVTGVILAHAMFGLPALTPSGNERAGWNMLLSEGVATFGLIGLVMVCARRAPSKAPFAIASYIVAGYWFTSSTSFANPAVTIARSLTDSFTGICYEFVPAFIAAQIAGCVLATLLFGWLLRTES